MLAHVVPNASALDNSQKGDAVTHYLGVAGKDPGSAYGIWFPDVPGCTSAADEFKDLFPNACEAVEVHLEGMAVPSARPIEEVMGLKDVRDGLADGSALMIVPFRSAGDQSA